MNRNDFSVSVFVRLILVLSIINFVCGFAYSETLKTEICTIKYSIQDENAARDISDLLSRKYDQIRKAINPKFNYVLNIEIYPSLEELNKARKVIGLREAGPGGGNAYGKNGIMIVSPTNPGAKIQYENVINVAVHEFTHLVINSIAGPPNKDSWIDESICYYMAEQQYGKVEYVKSACRGNDFTKFFYQTSYFSKALFFIGMYIVENYTNSQLIALLKTRSVAKSLSISDEVFFLSYCTWIESKS